MLFQDRHDRDESLTLDVTGYETAPEGLDSDVERNWLVLRGTWRRDGQVTKGSCTCLLTYELRELTAGLKVLNAGIRNAYDSDFVSPFFSLSALDLGDGRYGITVSFTFPDTMDGDDTADVICEWDKPSLRALLDELNQLCDRFPDREAA